MRSLSLNGSPRRARTLSFSPRYFRARLSLGDFSIPHMKTVNALADKRPCSSGPLSRLLWPERACARAILAIGIVRRRAARLSSIGHFRFIAKVLRVCCSCARAPRVNSSRVRAFSTRGSLGGFFPAEVMKKWRDLGLKSRYFFECTGGGCKKSAEGACFLLRLIWLRLKARI